MASKGQSIVRNEVHGESSNALQISPVTVETVTIDGIVEVTVSTSFKVNMGNYESKDCFASAKGRFAEDMSPADAGEFLFDHVYGTLNDELNAAKALAPKSSFIHKIVTD